MNISIYKVKSIKITTLDKLCEEPSRDKTYIRRIFIEGEGLEGTEKLEVICFGEKENIEEVKKIAEKG